MNKYNILIAGVGGQGILLTSKILGNIAIKKSLDVKVSEVHGMAQRGGSVITSVKISDKVYSPTIEKKEANILLAFELLEGLRWKKYLIDESIVILNNQKINPLPVIIGDNKYPEDVIGEFEKKFNKIYSLNGVEIAKECGNIKVINVLLLGVLAKAINFEKQLCIDSIKDIVNEKSIDINLRAFEIGYNYYKN
jgi:indolepyruvate ferredoxin oxidoreductase beta subunit